MSNQEEKQNVRGTVCAMCVLYLADFRKYKEGKCATVSSKEKKCGTVIYYADFRENKEGRCAYTVCVIYHTGFLNNKNRVCGILSRPRPVSSFESNAGRCRPLSFCLFAQKTNASVFQKVQRLFTLCPYMFVTSVSRRALTTNILSEQRKSMFHKAQLYPCICICTARSSGTGIVCNCSRVCQDSF